jgi:hypothetical protein
MIQAPSWARTAAPDRAIEEPSTVGLLLSLFPMNLPTSNWSIPVYRVHCVAKTEGGNGVAAMVHMVLYIDEFTSRPPTSDRNEADWTAAKIRNHGKFTLAVGDRKSLAFARERFK